MRDVIQGLGKVHINKSVEHTWQVLESEGRYLSFNGFQSREFLLLIVQKMAVPCGSVGGLRKGENAGRLEVVH